MEKMATVLLSLLLIGNAAGGAARGTWKVIDDKTGKVVSEIQLYVQGHKLYGKIAALAEPDDARGKPKVCARCPGDDKDLPVVGLVIVRDLSLEGDRYTGGTILDPQDGTVYAAELWPENGTLQVRRHAGALSKTQTWVR